MSFPVRIFAYRGLSQMPRVRPTQYSSDSVYQLEQPYEFSEKLTVNGATPVDSTRIANANVNILRVEVPDGSAVRYEINPTVTGARTPGDNSPRLTGVDQFVFKSGWGISFVDAASFP